MCKGLRPFVCGVVLIAGSVMCALADEGIYYVNPDGGRYYHAISQCPAIDSKYWNGMIEITGEQLESAEYQKLKKCERCAVKRGEKDDRDETSESSLENENIHVFVNSRGGQYYHATEECKAILEEERDVIYEMTKGDFLSSPWSYQVPCELCFSAQEQQRALELLNASDYYQFLVQEKHDEINLTGAGTYRIGKDIPIGLFTFEVEKGKTSEMSILRSKGQTQRFSIQGPGEYSFALFEDDQLTTDGHGMLRGFHDEMMFQKNRSQPVWIQNGRYLICEQMPAFVYQITQRAGLTASVILTEEGRNGEIQTEEIVLKQGEEFILDSGDYSYRFIELINCEVRVMN